MFLNTQAVVIGRRRWREADRFYILFTKELGRMEVKVRAAAKSTSKLAGHLEPLSVVDVLLLKGKYGWQLNNVVIVKKPLIKQPLSARTFGAVGTIVKSLIPIEQAETEIYNDLLMLLEYLQTSDDELYCRSALLRFVWRALALSGNDDIVSLIEGELDDSAKKLLQAARLGESLSVSPTNIAKAENFTEVICAERLEARVQLCY
jgi:DNA repair protein RecO (recombination protein O)